jgi:1-acyl-sn-glycerol-3-phosphate acyltransferase
VAETKTDPKPAAEKAAEKTAPEAPPDIYRLDRSIVRWIIGLLAKWFFRFYGRLKIIGLENVPRTGGVLIAGNHASNIDPVLGWAGLRGYRHIWGIAKSELFQNKIQAYCMHSMGSISIRRGMVDRTALKRILELLTAGEVVGIFPEGTRTHDGLLNPGQPGIGLMVQKSGVPVVPTAIIGTFEMLPRGAKKLRRVPLTMAFGKPMVFPPNTSRDVIADAIMIAIAELLTANGRPTEPPGPERAALLKAED